MSAPVPCRKGCAWYLGYDHDPDCPGTRGAITHPPAASPPTVDLTTALAEVDRVLQGAKAEIGEPANGYADGSYFARRAEVMKRCAADLTERLGARINDRWNGCSVRIAGVSSTCTAGMTGALQNWTAAARRRLAS